MARKQSDESFSEREIARRRDAALRVALNTPHKPHEPLKKAKPKISKPSDGGTKRENA